MILSPTKTKMAVSPQIEESPASTDGNSHNPFGIRLRRTQALQRFITEDQHTEPVHEAPQPTKVEPPQSTPPLVTPVVSTKPAIPKKPDTVEGATKTKRISDSGAGRSEAPSWISMAKQKQKIYKENSVENIAVSKEEAERRPSLTSVKEDSRTQESSKDLHRPPLEKVSHRPLSPPAPVPPVKASHICPTKPQSPPPPMTTCHLPHTSSPTPPIKPPHTSPPSTPQKPTPVPPLKLPHTTAPVKTPPPVPPNSPPPHQEEPPWMALAKKKAKAWSEMPQIVQ